MQPEDQEQIYVFLSPEIEALLADNGTNVAELLQSEGLPVQQAFATNPATDTAGGSKEPVTIILATAAVVVALTPVLIRLIERLTSKPIILKEKVLSPVEDSHGQVVHDANGEPVLAWQVKSTIIKAEKTPKEQTRTKIKGPLAIEIEYSSSPKE